MRASTALKDLFEGKMVIKALLPKGGERDRTIIYNACVASRFQPGRTQLPTSSKQMRGL